MTLTWLTARQDETREPSPAPSLATLSGGALLRDEYLRIKRRLIQFVERRVRSHAVAEDIVSEIYLRLDRANDTLIAREAATSYLYSMALNLVIDQSRQARRLNAFAEDVRHIPDRVEPSAERAALSRSDMAIVADALAELPPKAHEMLLCSRVLGMTYTEIAKHLNVTPSLVEKYVARALIHCRARLEELDAANDDRLAGALR